MLWNSHSHKVEKYENSKQLRVHTNHALCFQLPPSQIIRFRLQSRASPLIRRPARAPASLARASPSAQVARCPRSCARRLRQPLGHPSKLVAVQNFLNCFENPVNCFEIFLSCFGELLELILRFSWTVGLCLSDACWLRAFHFRAAVAYHFGAWRQRRGCGGRR